MATESNQEAPREALIRRHGWVFFPLAILLVLWSPYMGFTFNTDHDALAMVGWIRAHPGGSSWVNGFFLNGTLTGVMNALLNALGLYRDHLLLAYELVVLGALCGVCALSYFMLVELTGNVPLSVVLTLFLGTMPGMTNLLGKYEDNIVASFFHVQYLYICLRVVAMLRSESAGRSARSFLLYVVFPISFFLAIIAHHQLIVLLPTPALLPLFLPREGRFRKSILPVISCYVLATLLFSGIYFCLTIEWNGKFASMYWMMTQRNWFLPVGYYQGFYFYHQFGWDFARQIHEIAKGVSQIFAVDLQHAFIPFLGYGALLTVLQIGARWKEAWVRWETKVVVLFFVLHIPHSLIYESANVERWDVLMPPGILLVGILGQGILSRGRETRRIARLLMALMSVAFVMNLHAWYSQLASIRMMHQPAEAKEMLSLLRQSIDARRQEVRLVLLLTPEDFDTHFMAGEAYYSYITDIYVLAPDGEIWRSRHMYPNKLRLTRKEFLQATHGATIVASEEEQRLYKDIVEQ